MSRPPSRTPRPVGPPPDAASLRAAALAHVARFASTERGLAQVLERRITRWGRRAADDGQDISEVEAAVRDRLPLAATIAAEMVRLGAVDDAAFAKARTARLARSGLSRRAVQARLATKGLAPESIEQAVSTTLGDDEQARETELGAALVLARKRRVGPFSSDAPRPENMARIAGIFARAGFSHDTVRTALSMDREEAEDRIIALKTAL
ncbi:regulatory protein RecX [Acetobacter estunensis]|uniref:Regulatory protein RecX n=1 Tax=Acetobacter estunensis TaxID=104097 RepID=A0A967B5X6_9PROT|nr:RecX family transcriptional regulator [Acetobacter estunensis]NHO52999.1 regulatory protein RecX [Acetobacter estunensis]